MTDDVEPAAGGSHNSLPMADLVRRIGETPTMLFTSSHRLPPLARGALPYAPPFEAWSVAEAFAIDCLVNRYRPSPFSTLAIFGSRHVAEDLRQFFAEVRTDPATTDTDYVLFVVPPGVAEPAIPPGLVATLRPGGVLLIACAEFDIAGAAPWQLADMLGQSGLIDAGVLLRGSIKAIDQTHGAVVVARRPRKRAVTARPSRAPISVVIPVYNHERYLPETLESVFRQSLPPAEVIVIDDGSKDNSAAVAAELCSGFSGAVCWSHPNRGAHNTINAGLHRSTQPVVAILNSDDRYHPDRMALCSRLFEDSDVNFVASGLSFINDESEQIENSWFDDALGFWRQIGNTSLALLNGNFIMTTSNLLIRRSVFDEIGMFRNFRYAHDLDFFLRLLQGGKKLTFVAQPLADYRLHATNTIKEAHVRVRAEVAFLFTSILLSSPEPLLEGMNLTNYMRGFDEITRRHSLGACIAVLMQRIHQLGLRGSDCFETLMADASFRAEFHEVCS